MLEGKMATRTDTEKLAALNHINDVHIKNVDDEEGDKYLSQAGYFAEAIDAVLNDYDSPILRQFMEAEV